MPEKTDSKLLSTIMNSTQEGVVAIDAKGKVNLFNPAAERITGLTAHAVLGRPATEVIPNTRLHVVLKEGRAELEQLQRLGESSIITSRFPVTDEQGRITGAVAVFRDVTRLEDLSERLSDLGQARDLMEAVIDATHDAISVADVIGNNIIVNSAYTRITGLPKEAVIGKSATVDIAEGESMHMKVLRTGKPVKNVRLKVGPSKNEVIVNVAPIFIDGRIKGSVGVIHDISDIMELTEELTTAKKLLRHLEAKYTWEDIIGNSAAITGAKEQARRAAMTPATVLLLGESGTGKELFAHAIHSASSRTGGKFIRVNCATLTESLLESELFGYVEGAFTGAIKGGRKGLFEEADKGTLFLDEISDIGRSLQSKLLRVLQEKEIVRVGGTSPVDVDVRIIAATNADLQSMVHAGEFREDLFYRLNVIPIRIQPLRQRRGDILPTALHVLFRLNQELDRQVAGISDDAAQALQANDWPGNVRELENFLGRALINMSPKDTTIGLNDLPPQLAHTIAEPSAAPLQAQAPGPLAATLEAAERDALMQALKDSGGSRTKAAEALKISLRSLFYKISKHKIS